MHTFKQFLFGILFAFCAANGMAANKETDEFIGDYLIDVGEEIVSTLQTYPLITTSMEKLIQDPQVVKAFALLGLIREVDFVDPVTPDSYAHNYNVIQQKIVKYCKDTAHGKAKSLVFIGYRWEDTSMLLLTEEQCNRIVEISRTLNDTRTDKGISIVTALFLPQLVKLLDEEMQHLQEWRETLDDRYIVRLHAQAHGYQNLLQNANGDVLHPDYWTESGEFFKYLLKARDRKKKLADLFNIRKTAILKKMLLAKGQCRKTKIDEIVGLLNILMFDIKWGNGCLDFYPNKELQYALTDDLWKKANAQIDGMPL